MEGGEGGQMSVEGEVGLAGACVMENTATSFSVIVRDYGWTII